MAEGTIGQSSNGKLTLRLEAQAGYDAAQDRSTGNVRSWRSKEKTSINSRLLNLCLPSGRDREPKNGLDSAVKNMKLMEAIYTAAKTGRIVAVEGAK